MKDLTSEDLALIMEMINRGTFSGEGVEQVVSLKTKILKEQEKRSKM